MLNAQATGELVINKQTIGMHGVYRVAAALTGKGYVVSLTSRNSPGVDLHASTPDFTKAFAFEVKTLQRGSGSFLLNRRALHLSSKSYIYALLSYSVVDGVLEKFKYYIVPSAEMVRLAKEWRSGAYVPRTNLTRFLDKWDCLV
jgi:hypothetical protein